jgi:hypothetical protein
MIPPQKNAECFNCGIKAQAKRVGCFFPGLWFSVPHSEIRIPHLKH